MKTYGLTSRTHSFEQPTCIYNGKTIVSQGAAVTVTYRETNFYNIWNWVKRCLRLKNAPSDVQVTRNVRGTITISEPSEHFKDDFGKLVLIDGPPTAEGCFTLAFPKVEIMELTPQLVRFVARTGDDGTIVQIPSTVSVGEGDLD